MFTNDFYSNIDFNKLIATEECFQVNVKETYPVCYLIDLYLSSNFTKHKKEIDSNNLGLNFVSIKSRYIEKILGRKVLSSKKKEHLFFKVFEVDDNYKFNKNNIKETEKEDSYTKAYRLSNEYLLKVLVHKLTLSKSVLYSFSKFKVQKHYLIKGFSFKNRKEILESKIITRKEFDLNKEKYMDYYNSIMVRKPKEITFSDVNIETAKVDYFTLPKIDTEKVLSVTEDLSLEQIYGFTEYEALEYIRMTMKAKQNESGSKRQLYTRHESGRLVGIQIPSQNVNFQTLPKWQREIFFSGKFEYDLSNAVVTLFINLYKNLGGETSLKSVQDYMMNKKKYREYLIELGFSEKLAKQYFITLLYGKDLSNNIQESYKNTDWMQEVSEELFFKALENIEIENLLKELDYLKDFIIDYYRNNSPKKGHKYFVKNDNNFTKAFTKFDFEKNKGKILAHIFFGMESKIMDYIKDIFEPNLLIYDGFISDEDLNVNDLETLIFYELGYKVKFEKRLIGAD